MTAAIVGAGGRALVASAGGRLVGAVERAGGRHITLPLDTKNPWRIWRNAAALAELVAGGAGHDHPRPLARAGLVGAAGGAADGSAFRHHRARRLCRGCARQAPLQRGDGDGRTGDRQQPARRRTARATARRRAGAAAGDPARRRSGHLRSRRGERRAPRPARERLAPARRRAGGAAAGAADALEGADAAARGAGADAGAARGRGAGGRCAGPHALCRGADGTGAGARDRGAGAPRRTLRRTCRRRWRWPIWW